MEGHRPESWEASESGFICGNSLVDAADKCRHASSMRRSISGERFDGDGILAHTFG